MTQQITFIAHEQEAFVLPREDVFTLTPERGHVWLQKLAIWVLKKLRCQWWEKTVQVTSFEFEERDFITNLYRQRADLFDYFGRKGSTLLIGGEDFKALMRMATPAIIRDFEFHGKLGNSYKGLTVKVIPWMRGMVVV